MTSHGGESSGVVTQKMTKGQPVARALFLLIALKINLHLTSMNFSSLRANWVETVLVAAVALFLLIALKINLHLPYAHLTTERANWVSGGLGGNVCGRGSSALHIVRAKDHKFAGSEIGRECAFASQRSRTRMFAINLHLPYVNLSSERANWVEKALAQ